MKRILLFLLAFILCISLTITNDNPERGSFMSNITLLNGESILLKDAISSRESLPIINDNSHNLNSSAIMQSFNTDHHDISSINQYINDQQSYQKLGYWNILTGNCYSGNCMLTSTYGSAGDIKGYYHSLFQSKTCRKLMFEASLSIVESLCEDYPLDFLESVIQELDKLIELTEISNFYSQTYTYNEHEDSYWKGFVRRRVETDDVPISEIHSYLVEAKSKLLRIDQSLLSTALYEVNFNNDIKILLNSNGNTLSKDTKKIHYADEIRKVKYLEDQTGGYYLIEGKGFRDLYDYELNLVN